MDPIILNNKLQMAGLDDFREMTNEELAGLRRGIGNGESVSVISSELHMIISVGWKKEGGFLSRLITGSDLVANMESCYRKSFKPYGFTFDKYIDTEVAGVIANGLRYSYEAQGIGMTADSSVLKKDGILYYLHVYYRTKVKEMVEHGMSYDEIVRQLEGNEVPLSLHLLLYIKAQTSRTER